MYHLFLSSLLEQAVFQKQPTPNKDKRSHYELMSLGLEEDLDQTAYQICIWFQALDQAVVELLALR